MKIELMTGATMPTRGTDGSAGLDLYAIGNGRLYTKERTAVGTGVKVAIPHGFCGQIWPRSGLAVGKGIDVLGGLIDSDYRGEVRVILINHGQTTLEWSNGDRIAQLVIVPCLTEALVLGDLSDTKRGDSGFGSTGSA